MHWQLGALSFVLLCTRTSFAEQGVNFLLFFAREANSSVMTRGKLDVTYSRYGGLLPKISGPLCHCKISVWSQTLAGIFFALVPLLTI